MSTKKLYIRLVGRLYTRWGELFPMEDWRDAESAVDRIVDELVKARREAVVNVPRKYGMSFHPDVFTLLWPSGAVAYRMSTYSIAEVDRWADDGGAQ